MPDDARDRYLAELEALLPLPSERRAEILEEIEAHLEDSVEARVARGEPLEAAEMAAQDRLGRPRDLARDLARPEQSTWRVFAGVGAAFRSGVGHWLYGYLLGSLVILAGAVALAALVQGAGAVLGTRWTLQTTDQGWNTMLTAFAGAVGLYFAGRVLPDRVGRASRRLVTDVRPWVVGVATLGAAAVTMLVVDVPQNWASVVALVVTPAGVALGAYRPNLLPVRVRLSEVLIFFVLLAVGLLGVNFAGNGALQGVMEVTEEPPDRGLGMVGPEWHPVRNDLYGTALQSSSWGETDGMARWHGELAPGVSLAGFTDLRLEAWRAIEDGMRLDPAHPEPFATAAVDRDGDSLSALIDTTGEPGVTSWSLILTAVASDGVRYVLDASMSGQSTFTGSVWDWVVAVTRDP